MARLKSLKFWLLLSLALNFLVIGMVVGRAAFGGDNERMRPPINEIAAIFRALPEDGRQVLGARVKGRIVAHRRDRPGFDIEEIADLIGAQPFDPQALRAVFAQRRANNDAIAKLAHEDIVSAILGLDRTERQKVAERLRHLPRLIHGGHAPEGLPPRQ